MTGAIEAGQCQAPGTDGSDLKASEIVRSILNSSGNAKEPID